MSWQTRKNHATAYYRSRRVNGRVITEYFGSGLRGRVGELADSARREERHSLLAQYRAAVKQLNEMQDLLAGSSALLELVTTAILVATGYHLHKGEWRRRRTTRAERPSPILLSSESMIQLYGGAFVPLATDLIPIPNTDSDRVSYIRNLLARTQCRNPEPGALQDLRQLLATDPHFWRLVGDLSANSRRMVLETTFGEASVREAALEGANQLRQALTLPTDTALEQVLIEQCITSHTMHLTLQARYIQVHTLGLTIEQAVLWEKRLDASHNRFLRTLETLARLRRLNLPLVQINIATNQTNVAASNP